MGYPKKPVVLVVDDTIANIRILDDLLRGEYTVRVATNGATALRLALSEPRPDIVLLDIMMPDMDGYEVCRRLKSDPLTSNIAVVSSPRWGTRNTRPRGSISGPWTSSPSPSSPASSGAGIESRRAQKIQRRAQFAGQGTHQGTVSFPFRDGGMSRFGRGNPR